MTFDLTAAYPAIFSAVFGGVGIKILERMLSKKSEQFNDATTIRDELRVEIEHLKEEIDVLRKQLEDSKIQNDTWREKYWNLVERISNLPSPTSYSGSLSK